jgi:archaellum component FlaG (FlaF/FlaG flagellin family)
VAAYFTGSYSLSSELGSMGTVGDLQPVFIESKNLKTLTYDAKMTGQNLTADAFVVYGESPRALENEIRKRYTIEAVTIIDNAQIDIISVTYDLKKGLFLVEIKNTGETDAYVNTEIIDVIVDGERYSFASEGTIKIEAGKTAIIEIRPNPVMQEIDLADNKEITVQANYGERSESLVKTVRKSLPLAIQSIDYAMWAMGAAIVIIILFIIIILLRKKCKHCKHKNWPWRTSCSKCSEKLH